eukprot:scaffold149_cov315-Pinguiococcus_pyrenoidosus.AAC.92
MGMSDGAFDAFRTCADASFRRGDDTAVLCEGCTLRGERRPLSGGDSNVMRSMFAPSGSSGNRHTDCGELRTKRGLLPCYGWRVLT